VLRRRLLFVRLRDQLAFWIYEPTVPDTMKEVDDLRTDKDGD